MGPLSLHTNNQSIITTKLFLLENCLLLCCLFLPFIFYFLVVLVCVTCAYVMLQWKIPPHLDDQQPYSHTLHYNWNCTPWTTHTYVPKHAHMNTNTCACTHAHTHTHTQPCKSTPQLQWLTSSSGHVDTAVGHITAIAIVTLRLGWVQILPTVHLFQLALGHPDVQSMQVVFDCYQWPRL